MVVKEEEVNDRRKKLIMLTWNLNEDNVVASDLININIYILKIVETE